jgi:hypothetical protein
LSGCEASLGGDETRGSGTREVVYGSYIPVPGGERRRLPYARRRLACAVSVDTVRNRTPQRAESTSCLPPLSVKGQVSQPLGHPGASASRSVRCLGNTPGSTRRWQKALQRREEGGRPC